MHMASFSTRFAYSIALMGALLLAPAAARASADTSADAAQRTHKRLAPLVELAKQNAPEVAIAKASLTSSRSALQSSKLLPFGNPYLEITAERGGKKVTKDVSVNSSLWLPVEASGQKSARTREAREFVALHSAFVEQTRAQAAARLVRAYGAAAVSNERIKTLSELLNNARSEAELLAERVRAGDAVQQDASLSAVEAARHEVMLAETRAERLQAGRELAEVLGRDLGEAADSVTPPALSRADLAALDVKKIPRARALQAEARFHASSSERLRREGQTPISVGLIAGRGDLGEARLGGGLAYALPVFRANRPERARATAESTRALAEKRVHEAVAAQRLQRLQSEQDQVMQALSALTSSALPAAESAVKATQETYAAGKAELLAVLLTRRELSMLSLRRLELLDRSWEIASEYVALTGELP